ncbi:MAG: hypothetical protein ACRDTF_22590, partial [Pseudonocardiaceae bacterium]
MNSAAAHPPPAPGDRPGQQRPWSRRILRLSTRVARRHCRGHAMAMPLRHDPGSLMTIEEWVALPEDNTYRY